MINCKGCGMMKLDTKSKCACNVTKPFDAKKLSKKTKEEKKPKAIKQVSEKKKERLKTNGTEGEMFKKEFLKREKNNTNYCMICKCEVLKEDFVPACIPHILPKSKYPTYRYFTNNLGFVCWISDHNKFDEAINNFKQDRGLIELEKIIKNWDTPDISDYIDN